MVPQLRDPVKPPLLSLAAKDRANKKLQAQYYNKRHRARELDKLTPGESVWVTDMKTRGTVLATGANPRSHIIRTEEGVTLRRNRRMLNCLPQQGKREGSYEFPNESEPAELVSAEREPPTASISVSVPSDSDAVI